MANCWMPLFNISYNNVHLKRYRMNKKNTLLGSSITPIRIEGIHVHRKVVHRREEYFGDTFSFVNVLDSFPHQLILSHFSKVDSPPVFHSCTVLVKVNSMRDILRFEGKKFSFGWECLFYCFHSFYSRHLSYYYS